MLKHFHYYQSHVSINSNTLVTEGISIFQEIPLKSFPTRIMRESIVNKLPGGDLINKIKTQISKSVITGRREEGAGLNHLHNFYR